MFTVKQLFTENYLLLSHITLFLVNFNSAEVILFQSFMVSISYQNNEVTSIKMLLEVPYSFHLSCLKSLNYGGPIWGNPPIFVRFNSF